MIDHLLGRPSTRLKRVQVLLVLSFWGWIIRMGPRDGPGKIPFVKRMNAYAKRFTPWQIFVFALTSVYAVRHLDAVAGFGAPEPLARMYSRSFYRATWINTALDAGFASAMSIRPQWLRDIASVLMSLYYVIYANEADEKLRKYRAFCTVDFLRATWNKTSNPYIRAVTWLSFHRISIAEPILLPRPSIGPHSKRPIRAMLFYYKPLRFLREEDELIIDFVGGGFVSMGPEHHEDRLRQLAAEHKRPILAVDYCKAPEYPYPYALEECFDLFRSLHECKGSVLGMSGRSTFRTILTGDSAGGNLALGVMLKILEYPQAHIKSAYAAKAAGGPGSAPPPLPRPIALILNYPATNFAFTSWMKPDHLNVLRSQSEVNLQLIEPMRGKNEGKDSVDSNLSARNRLRGKTRSGGSQTPVPQQTVKPNKSYTSLANQAEMHLAERARMAEAESSPDVTPQTSWIGRIESDEMDRQASTMNDPEHQQRLAQQRELQAATEKMDLELNEKKAAQSTTVNTRLTMTSMAGYFQDRILTQSMMRAMAILYIGPRRQPDFDNDYYLSPIVAPAKYLADFPPVLFTCGEKDPICDDTVVMAGRIRQAKLARQMALKKRGARFGEQLRMSGSTMVEEEEDVDDWVQMRIIEGWSHGYLQMSALLPEVKKVISFLAQWTADAFDDYTEHALTPEQRRSESARLQRTQKGEDVSTPSSSSSLEEKAETPTKAQTVPARPKLGVLQPPPTSSDEEDDTEALTFTPKSRRSPSLQSQDSQASTSVRQSRGSPSTSPHFMPSKAPFNPINKIQEQAMRSRPNSFSTVESKVRANAAAAAAANVHDSGTQSMLLPPPSVPIRRRRSNDHQPPLVGGEGSLVKESTLLERRRLDALGYIGGNAEVQEGSLLKHTSQMTNSALDDSSESD